MYDVVKPLCENFVLEIKELLNILNKHDWLSLYFVFSFILSGGVDNNGRTYDVYIIYYGVYCKVRNIYL